MDCSVTPTKFPDIKMVQTTDFFYPLVDDPYMQGKIGCANVLSDLYSMGIVDCDNMLMLLAASTDMDKNDRSISTRMMIEGFNDQATFAQTKVTGGQTVMNPWPIIGGIASAICRDSDFILPENAIPGDVLVLTKPLGTQIAVNAHQWLHIPEKWERIKDVITPDEAERCYEVAMESMARLNRTGARLMHKYHAHACTDVTGFGIMGHARNLAKNQKEAVQFEIHTLPIIRNMREVDEKVKIWKLMDGFSAETSGGLLIAMSEENASAFIKEIEEIDKCPAWIIGRVIKSEEDRTKNSCELKNPIVLEI